MTPDEKQILLREIPKYIKENCYYTDGSIKSDDLWLVGWVAAEFHNPRNAMKVLIRNEYGLLGNLLNKLARNPDDSITRFIERTDSEVLLKALNRAGNSVLRRNELTYDPYAMKLLIAHDRKYLKYVDAELFKSKPFLLSVVSHCPEILPKAFLQVFRDHDFVFSLVQKNCACLKYLPQEFRSDYKLCLEAVRREGFSLMYIDFNLRSSDEIVLAAVSNRGNALSLSSAQQKKIAPSCICKGQRLQRILGGLHGYLESLRFDTNLLDLTYFGGGIYLVFDSIIVNLLIHADSGLSE